MTMASYVFCATALLFMSRESPGIIFIFYLG
jgi:hypothetical protein